MAKKRRTTKKAVKTTKKVTSKKVTSKKVASKKSKTKKETKFKLPKTEKDTWVALISDNGEELLKLVADLGYWPGVIITNNSEKKDWHSEIVKREEQETNRRKKKVHVVNIAQSKTANFIHRFARTDDTIVTTNSWNKKIPTAIGDKYQITDGRPVENIVKVAEEAPTRTVGSRERVDVDPRTLGQIKPPEFKVVGERPKQAKPWIAMFSQSGSEIVKLSERLGFWPDHILTDNSKQETWHPDMLQRFKRNQSKKFSKTPIKVVSKQEAQTCNFLHSLDKHSLVTLHGWLRIVPKNICEQYHIVNGHPGLITQFPDLKGKDPQARWWANRDKYDNWYGSVVHDVIAEVDSGTIHAVNKRQLTKYEEQDCDPFELLQETSLNSWLKYFAKFPIK